MKILNLGCGTKVSRSPDVVNIDWSIYLRLRKNPILRVMAPHFLRGERLHRFKSLAENILIHNLAKGIPFDSNSVDIVYHSHLLEHLDRDVAKQFLLEVKRVLKPGGIQRIGIPDLERACKAYISHLAVCDENAEEFSKHDLYIAPIIEQSVRREAYGTNQQPPVRRFLQNVFLGDARRRGETHQWMYDRVNLSALLISLGYKNIRIQQYNTSLIPGWNQYGLDLTEFASEYKPESMYIECQK